MAISGGGTDEEDLGSKEGKFHLSRRTVIGAMGVGAAAVGAGGLLAACSSDSGTTAASTAATPSDSPASASTAPAPKLGGQLRVGVVGASTSDSLDPSMALTVMEASAAALMFDALVMAKAEGGIENVLAESFEPNEDATVWTVRLREGLVFHDGKPVTADDVIFSIQHVVDPATKSPYADVLSGVDVPKIQKMDNLTVEIPMKAPNGIFPDTTTGPPFMMILPVGFDPKKPVGTGPFVFQSFTPGQELKVTRNPNYFVTGQPYLDEVVVTAFPDEASEINALISGNADVITGLTAASRAAIESGGGVVAATATGGWTPIIMNMQQAPFDNADVRTAFKLIVDRQQLIDTIWGGDAQLGNDVFGKFDPLYNAGLPQRELDVEKAKELLKKAGQENLTVEFTTSDIFAGTVDLATVFAQQAKAAGVTVNVKKVDAGTFFGDGWLSYPLTTDYWSSSQLLPIVGQTLVTGAAYPETGFSDPEYDALYQRAIATPDPTLRASLVEQMQQIEWDKGGYIIPFFVPVLVGHAPNVKDITEYRTMSPLNRFRNVRNMWIE